MRPRVCVYAAKGATRAATVFFGWSINAAMGVVASTLQTVGKQCYHTAIGAWLWRLYRFGPLWLGCWAGLDDEDVCARLAGNSVAADWRGAHGAVRCQIMIDRSFTSFATLVHVCMWAWLLWSILSLAQRYVMMRIMARHLILALQPPNKPALNA